MATLQNIRSKGPLLVAVIGLALFAFIAGDAWKAIQPHQSQDIGEINGDALSAQDYQALVEEYTDVVKFSSGQTSLSEEQTNQIKDEVWRNYVNNKLIEDEAKKIGLTVSPAEIQAVIDAGVNPMLQQTPFRNPQTGAFDKDMLKKFLVDYSKMDLRQMPAQYADYYEAMYKYWSFIEKSLAQNILAEKYHVLISNCLLSNPIEAQDAFDARVNQADVLLAAIPYSSIPDSSVQVKESELKELYNKRKEEFRQYVETRDIKYIDILVTASPEDRAAIESEVTESAQQLAETDSDYASFIRSTGSDYPYVDLFYNKTAFPSDVVARLDSATIGRVYGPYYNVADNTINSFKVVARTNAADSVEFKQIQVYADTPAKTKDLADSIYNAIKDGANFSEVAARYGQNGETTWLTSAQYEGAQLDNENLKYISAINNMNTNELTNLAMGQANVIVQVTNKKANKDKYKIAVVKRPVEFSKETYRKAYNDFSQFISANPTLDNVKANAEEFGYRLLDRADLTSAEHTVGGVKGTKDALKWAFAAKPGEVSGLYECGESDHLMVVALETIKPTGYRSLKQVQNELRAEIVKDKKAEIIMSQMKAANASTFAQYKDMNNAVSDSIKFVTFAAPAYVPALRSSEPLVGAYAVTAEMNKLSAPIKGNAGVLVLQKYAEDKLNETYNQATEEAQMQTMHTRFANRLLNDLYIQAKVVDTRYLYF